MKRILAHLAALGSVFAFLALAAIPNASWAQQTARVVASCGSAGYTAGFTNYVTMDTTGATCGASSGGGGGAVTIADGADVTLGAKANAATCATTNTLIACTRQIDADINGPTPAGTNQIGNLVADTHAQTTTLGGSLVVKSAAGTLKTFEAQADSTLAAAAWYVMIFDATSAPADGTVTPAKCYAQTAGQTQMGGTLSTGGSAFTTGITFVLSTTGCYTKTISAHGYIAADFQ